MLAGIVSGATIPLIQLRELLRLTVLIPDELTAHQAIEALNTERRLQEEIDRLQREQSQAAAHMWTLS